MNARGMLTVGAHLFLRFFVFYCPWNANGQVGRFNVELYCFIWKPGTSTET